VGRNAGKLEGALRGRVPGLLTGTHRAARDPFNRLINYVLFLFPYKNEGTRSWLLGAWRGTDPP